jgi:hypothetical protein
MATLTMQPCIIVAPAALLDCMLTTLPYYLIAMQIAVTFHQHVRRRIAPGQHKSTIQPQLWLGEPQAHTLQYCSTLQYCTIACTSLL